MQTHLKALYSCKARLNQLHQELAGLAAPRLPNLDQLPFFYADYCAAIPLPIPVTRQDYTLHRRVFVAIALYACDPLALTGEKMRPGLRATLAKTLHISPSFLSRDIDELPFLLAHDRPFVEAAQRAWGALVG